MNKNFKKFIALAITITTAISAMTGFSASAENVQRIAGSAGTNVTYTGNPITPEISLYDDDTLLVRGVDYDLEYENNVNVGVATIIVKFKGNYSGERRINFNIIAKELTQGDVVISPIENQTYTGEPITPKPTVTFGDITLKEDTDYDLEYENNTSVGTATVKVNFKGNYSGAASTQFEIIAKNLTDDDTVVMDGGSVSDQPFTGSSIPDQIYTGEPIEPKPEIKYGDKVLEEGKDYDLEYENNEDVGEAKVKVKFKGNYEGEKEYTFEILKKSVTDADITGIEDAEYTGSEIRPEPVIKVDGRTLEANKDYTVDYKDNVNVGTATVTITFIGNYDGELTRNFNITPFVVTEDNIKISNVPDQIYTGSEITPDVTVTVLR
ncbi:MAG: hypothetical protein J1F01_00750 [Oscillospiraceae bacterium]|nr:hypothetical protein [Oscillospiraceae bacterium]